MNKLEQVKKQAAEMRVALEMYADPSFWSLSDGKNCRLGPNWDLQIADEGIAGTPGTTTFACGKHAAAALSSDAGKDYIHRDDITPLLAALVRARTDFEILICRGDLCDEPRAHETLKRLNEAIAHAKAKGIISP